MLTMPELKICGLTRPEEIEIINQFPVAYAGFIFAKKSKRYVTPKQAVQMIKILKKGIRAVGVFVDTPIEEVNQIAEEAQLNFIQLHSNETNEDCKKAVRPVWKMISMKGKESIHLVQEYPSAAGILLDTYHPSLMGGTGQTFCWKDAENLSGQKFIILAGGLSPENILDAAKIVHPQVLDVNSGVETDGKKDEKKIEELVRRLYYEI